MLYLAFSNPSHHAFTGEGEHLPNYFGSTPGNYSETRASAGSPILAQFQTLISQESKMIKTACHEIDVKANPYKCKFIMLVSFLSIDLSAYLRFLFTNLVVLKFRGLWFKLLSVCLFFPKYHIHQCIFVYLLFTFLSRAWISCRPRFISFYWNLIGFVYYYYQN